MRHCTFVCTENAPLYFRFFGQHGRVVSYPPRRKRSGQMEHFTHARQVDVFIVRAGSMRDGLNHSQARNKISCAHSLTLSSLQE